MKFAIIGAGAMGCRLAYFLHKANFEVILVDTWKDHVDIIRQRGLEVDYNGEIDVIDLPIYYPEEVTEDVDVAIVLTKSMQLEGMLAAVQGIFHDKTKAVCLLNGLEHQKVMEKYIPKENVIMGTTIWTAQLAGPGKAVLHGSGAMSLQNDVDTPEAVQATKEIVAALSQAQLNASYSQDVATAIWRKVIVNCCGNATTALLECQLEGFFGNDYGVAVVRELTRECVAVAKTQGINLDLDELSQFIVTASLKVGEHYSSMYQDLVANHRVTEVDYLNGYISKLGKEHGIPTPYNDLITQFIHVKELVLKAK